MGECFLGSGSTALRNHVREDQSEGRTEKEGSRVQPEHALGPGHAFHCFNTPVVSSLGRPRTRECFLMVEQRTGFRLIITANLPQGQNNRFKLKALLERLSFNARHIFDAGEKKRGLSSRRLINEHPPSSFFFFLYFCRHPHPGHPIPHPPRAPDLPWGCCNAASVAVISVHTQQSRRRHPNLPTSTVMKGRAGEEFTSPLRL